MKVKGHGGFWVLEPAQEGPENSIVHNAEYEVHLEEEIREVRSAGCQGYTEALPRVKRITSARFRVAEDDVAYPQALGFREGLEVSFWLKRGALNQYDKIHLAIVETVRVRNHQQQARWVEIVCSRGRYERHVSPPTLPEPVIPDPEEES